MLYRVGQHTVGLHVHTTTQPLVWPLVARPACTLTPMLSLCHWPLMDHHHSQHEHHAGMSLAVRVAAMKHLSPTSQLVAPWPYLICFNSYIAIHLFWYNPEPMPGHPPALQHHPGAFTCLATKSSQPNPPLNPHIVPSVSPRHCRCIDIGHCVCCVWLAAAGRPGYS